MPEKEKMRIGLIASALGVILAGCGGGSSSSGSSTPLENLSLVGTVATGTAVSGATVSAKCRSGAGNATTINDGTYAMTVNAATFPCILQATIPGRSDTLHSVAVGNGSAGTARSNITPLTELLTARLSRSDPGAFFTAFDANASAGVTPASVAVAQVDVATVLASLGEASNVGDFVGAPLKAALPGAGTGGDAHDNLLEILKEKLSPAQFGQVRTALAGTASTADVAQLFAGLAGTTVTALPIDFTEIQPDQLDFTESDVAKSMVIVDASTWADVWGRHAERLRPPLPAIDFTKSIVLGTAERVFLGGTRLRVKRVYRIGQKIFFEYEPFGLFGYVLTTYRGLYAVIERTGYPIEFIELPLVPCSPPRLEC
jgi:hypothetical protein